jgi:hypothetical protein
MGVSPQVWRQSVGVYMMFVNTVDAHYPADHRDGVYQVTAYGREPARCDVHGENDEMPTPIGVFCVDADGAPVDTRFVVTYAHGVNALGTGVPAANAHYSYFSDDVSTWYLLGYRNVGGPTGFTRVGVGDNTTDLPADSEFTVLMLD